MNRKQARSRWAEILGHDAEITGHVGPKYPDKTEVVNGPRTTTVKSDTVTVEETQKITAKKIELNASEEILLVCGASSIKLTPQLIEELADMIHLNCK